MASQDSYTFRLADFAGETSTFTVGLSDVNVDIALVFQWADDMRARIAEITNGLLVAQQLSIPDQFQSAGARSTVASSDRENKWLVIYEDTTEYFNPPINSIRNAGFRKLFSIEVPTANLTLRASNSDTVWTRGGGAANVAQFNTFVTTLEQRLRSPYGGVGQVVQIRSVARNI